MFSNNFEITYIFQFLMIHFCLTHVRTLSTNLYLAHDSIFRKIQIRRRIGIILEPFIRALFWRDAG